MTASVYTLEGSIQQHGDKVRVRLRLCQAERIVEAFSRTFTSLLSTLVAVREFLPREFDRDPQIQREVYAPIEEIWRARLRYGGPY